MHSMGLVLHKIPKKNKIRLSGFPYYNLDKVRIRRVLFANQLKDIFCVGLDTLLVSAEFQTEPLVTQCYLLLYFSKLVLDQG